jgi:succinate dehydrogenase/fumarate reductase flavoprotein subunit
MKDKMANSITYFDLIIVGGGGAAVLAALSAKKEGANVALIVRSCL